MSLQSVDPKEAQTLAEKGAILIDVREADEYARSHIPGSVLLSLSELDRKPLPEDGKSVIFLCKSGMRTQSFAPRLFAKATQAGKKQAYAMSGGLDAWKRQGLPSNTVSMPAPPMAFQVQAAIIVLAVGGLMLGSQVSPWFYALAGLALMNSLTAAFTGICPMARVLRLAPWNRTQG